MSQDYSLDHKMGAFLLQVRDELAREQVTHPIKDYTPERLERLRAQMDLAKRFQSPKHFTVNV